MRYSKTTIKKVILGKDGEERIYRARKMGSFTVAKEGFKLITTLSPSVGVGLDSIQAQAKEESLFDDGQSHTFGAMLSMLSEHLTGEHFEDLSIKLMGSLMLGDDEIKDLEAHFDEYEGDYIDILAWLLKENFTNFTLGSVIVQSWIAQISTLLTPEMKNTYESLKKSLGIESKEG